MKTIFLPFLLLAAPLWADGTSGSWRDLPAIPNPIGLGGPYVGVSDDLLVVAGGANFPHGLPWQVSDSDRSANPLAGNKIWHRQVYLLDGGDDSPRWIAAGELPFASAYGATISTDDGIILIGGLDHERCFDSVLRIRWAVDEDGERSIELDSELPPLPEPSGFLSAARIGDTIYVAAGQKSTDPLDLQHRFWALDLTEAGIAAGWRDLPPWPGGGRIKTVAVVQGDGHVDRRGKKRQLFYLISGEIPRAGADGAIEREYPADGYRYIPGENRWETIASPPRPCAAAAAIGSGDAHVIVFSGADGNGIEEPPAERPPFPENFLAYHTITDSWISAGEMPQEVVTTTAAWWQGEIVIPTGEVRPGVRTDRVQSLDVAPAPVPLGTVGWGVLIAYLVVLVWMGARFSRGNTDTESFFLARRRIPWWAAGISIFATQLSAITFVATPALAFSQNWVLLPGTWMITLMAPVVIFFYLPFFRRLNITTAYEFLEKRFGLITRLYGSSTFIFFQLLRMAIVTYLPALALSAITGIDIYLCITGMGILATVYTVLGGMEAVVWTDVLQTVVLTAAVIFGIVLCFIDDGAQGMLSTAVAEGKMQLFRWQGGLSDITTWAILIGVFALQFHPYTTDQAVIQRYLSTKDEKAAARGIWLNGLLAVPVGLVFFLLGTGLWIFFRQHPEMLQVGMKNDAVFPLFVASQMPAPLAGLVIAGIFAASMSSLDSSMHSVATAFTHDFWRRFHPGASDRQLLKVARTVVVVMGILGCLVAGLFAQMGDIPGLFQFFQKVLGLTTSGLVAIFILGIFTRRATQIGVITGALVSIALLAALEGVIHIGGLPQVNFYLYPVIGIVSAVITGWAVSFFTPTPKVDH